MKESRSSSHSRHGPDPGLQVICLASGGGPSEENVTGFLVRSISTQWAKNSVLAVDAGSHMAAITKILESDFPRITPDHYAARTGKVESTRLTHETPSDYSSTSSRESTPEQQITRLKKGPFAGAAFPYRSARANSLHFVRECVSTYLITHPHLDHICALAINTAAFHNTSRPKRLAALPSTVSAIKAHIFNDIIWPNLTDEDGGVGFVTFQRLAQGGNIAVGEGSGKGYIEVCDGLCVKGMKVSHGHCTRGPSTLHPRGSDVGLSEATVAKSALLSSSGMSTFPTGNAAMVQAPGSEVSPLKGRTPSLTQFIQPAPDTPGMTVSSSGAPPTAPSDPGDREVVVDSTAYFIRDDYSKREVLIFGDVEPDSISWAPRTFQVWQEAAPKVASGALKAIVIECSYDDSQSDAVLFGHLAPRHLVRELAVLAGLARQKRAKHREKKEIKKRKRRGSGDSQTGNDEIGLEGTISPMDMGAEQERAESVTKRKRQRPSSATNPISYGSTPVEAPLEQYSGARKSSVGSKLDELFQQSSESEMAPLSGLKVMIMHMKDTMRDGPLVGESILRQLNEHEMALKDGDGLGLGCEFIVCRAGASYLL